MIGTVEQRCLHVDHFGSRRACRLERFAHALVNRGNVFSIAPPTILSTNSYPAPGSRSKLDHAAESGIAPTATAGLIFTIAASALTGALMVSL